MAQMNCNVIGIIIGFISFVRAQVSPVSFVQWDATQTTSVESCRAVGGYDYSTDKIRIYGSTASATNSGTSDTAYFVFDPTTESYDSTSNVSPTGQSLTVTGSTAQFIGDNTIYFEVSGNIEGIDMETQTRAVYATLNTSISQTDPGLCMDDDANILYSVGDAEVERCTLVSGGTGECTTTTHVSLQSIQKPACAVYDGGLFIFGGVTDTDNQPTNDIIYCSDPSIADNCVSISAQLTTARGDIRPVIVECFGNNFVYLLGGEVAAVNPSGVTELFNMETQTIAKTADFSSARKEFVAVFDPINEQIFALGGTSNQGGNACYESFEVTAVSSAGMCQTDAPSTDPTMQPTSMPSSNPTTNPITSSPTSNPTNVPSANPIVTNNPTTTTPSASPTTKAPTNKPEVYDPETTSSGTPVGAYVFIFFMLAVVCCIIIICAVVYSRNEKEKERSYGDQTQTAAVPIPDNTGANGGATYGNA